jgi:predicted lipoprotein with Yx(FWY)xxD motif
MKRWTIALAALTAVVAAVALAACGGDAYDTNEPPRAQSDDDPAAVSVEELAGSGRVLVDSTGKPLYAADEEEGGVVCIGACASFWVPLTSDGGTQGGDRLPGDLGVVEREDGTRQVTYDGRRLYRFAGDGPGEVSGDGLSDEFGGQRFTWHVVRAGDDADPNQADDLGGRPYGY